ncbi:hypothetical protein CDD82_6529 [Ophiocordyceps australis]|uniref:Nucleotide-diphospho-sugar transferase domain-containing protein n=1 Tax=Ophiocordyceps australis TaxID=1399860 RepID=A0A2C5XZY2_9HYPO|nr:hypothetical protein CDD82_6529 [Ophiocordyceps australis]
MILSASLRSKRGTGLVVGAVFCFILLVGLTVFNSSWDEPPRAQTAHQTSVSPPDGTGAAQPDASHRPHPKLFSSDNADELRKFFYEEMWKPSVQPYSLKYKPFGAFDWTLPEPPRWNRHLGENFCIIDLDNRLFNESGQLFGPELMSWDRSALVDGLSLGILNHWLYAKIHGYKYYYIDIEAPVDRRASWKKPPVLSRILKEHDTCVYLDSDAIFYRLDLPFEWLLNYWRLFPDSNSLALATDPDVPWNRDKFNKVYLNTGFIVAQNNPDSFAIFDAWQRCPDDGAPYPECTEFRLNAPGRPTDQGGFGTFVRYDFNNSIRELSCVEANGFPESDSGCKGQFIRHVWTSKQDQLKIDVGTQIPGPFLSMIHKQYLDEKKTFYITERDLLSKGPKAALKHSASAPHEEKEEPVS